MKSVASVILFLFGSLAIAGCDSVPVVRDVGQRQAMEIVAELNSKGLPAYAEKETGGSGRFQVEVQGKSYREATSLLFAKGLPRREETTIDELLAPQGILPSSREIEALRADRALALEVERVLGSYPDVKAVKAIIRARSIKDGEKPGASVVVVNGGADPSALELFTRMVETAVPGLERERIILSVRTESESAAADGRKIDSGDPSPKLRRFLWLAHVPEDEYPLLALTLVGCILAVAAAGGVIGYWFSAMHLQKTAATETSISTMPEPVKRQGGPFEKLRRTWGE